MLDSARGPELVSTAFSDNPYSRRISYLPCPFLRTPGLLEGCLFNDLSSSLGSARGPGLQLASLIDLHLGGVLGVLEGALLVGELVALAAAVGTKCLGARLLSTADPKRTPQPLSTHGFQRLVLSEWTLSLLVHVFSSNVFFDKG